MLQLDRRAFVRGSAATGLALGLGFPARARGPAAFPPPTREAMVAVPGGSVYVRVNGALDGPRPPLVMIHGGPGGTHAGFLPALALADERAIILYDQLGSGRSTPATSADWKVPRFVAELEPIREALGIPRWHVLGHSWGGTVALEYGARRLPALAGLALASPLISTRSWIADATALREQLPARVRETLRRCDPPRPVTPACEAATREFYARHLMREPPMAAVRVYAVAQKQLGGRGNNLAMYEGMWGRTEFYATGTLRNYDGEPLLSRLNGPRTLFLVGQHDEARPLTAMRFVARLPGAEWAVIPGSGHALFGDRPDETITTLRAWLRRQDAA